MVAAWCTVTLGTDQYGNQTQTATSYVSNTGSKWDASVNTIVVVFYNASGGPVQTGEGMTDPAMSPGFPYGSQAADIPPGQTQSFGGPGSVSGRIGQVGVKSCKVTQLA